MKIAINRYSSGLVLHRCGTNCRNLCGRTVHPCSCEKSYRSVEVPAILNLVVASYDTFDFCSRTTRKILKYNIFKISAVDLLHSAAVPGTKVLE